MSLRHRTLRPVVWVGLCAFLSSTLLPLYESHGLGAADDAACLTFPGQQATPTLTVLGSGEPPAHCAVCHLLRAVNGTVAPTIVALTVPAPLAATPRRLVDVTIAAEHSARASRAPPTSSFA